MAVQFKCRGCEEVLKAPDTARGKVMTCKSCGKKNRIPEGKGSAGRGGGGTKSKPRRKLPPKRPAGDDDFLAGDLSAEDTRYVVCQQCGEQFLFDPDDEEADTACPYCGFDQQRREYTKSAKRERIKSTGRVDTSEYFDVAAGESFGFLKRHLGLAAKSGMYVTLPTALCLGFGFLAVYNGKTPPKVFFAFLSGVFGLMPIGWMMSLTFQSIHATLEKKEVIKRPQFDMFQNAANGVMFLALQVAYLLPAILAMVGAYYYGEDEHEMGIALMCAGPVLMLPLYPVILSHLAMPVSWPGWLFTKGLQLFFGVIGAAFYWMALTLMAVLPGLIGLGVAGGVFGGDVQAVMEDVEYNAKLGYEKYLAERGDTEQPAGEYREPAYDLLVPPLVLVLISAYYIGFVWAYPARINGHMAYFFLKDLELIQEKAQKKYVARERYVDEEGIVRLKGRGGVGGNTAFAGMGGLVALVIAGTIIEIVTGSILPGEEKDTMEVIAVGVAGIGYAIALVGGIMILIAAFNESVGWGLLSLFVPIAALVFVFTHWDESKEGFILNCVGTVVMIIGLAMGADPSVFSGEA